MIQQNLQLIIKQKRLILLMAKRELSSRYVGSFLGFLWSFINPIVMIFVFWVVFSVGFKSKPMGDVPFVVWLTAGMAPWFAFAEMIIGSAGVVVAHSHLIKKTIFPSQVLPLVTIVSSILTHAIFMAVLAVLILFQKMPISLWYIQFLYYLFALCVLCTGFGWLLSALTVFVRDVSQIAGVMIQIGFWATPIFWDINIMPKKIQTIFKLNPVYYIVQGYRDSFISFQPFWKHPEMTIWFWTVTLLVFTSGAIIFRKLKPHFADVL